MLDDEALADAILFAIDKAVAPLFERIRILEAREPARGEKGEPGERGANGADGANGKDGKDGVDGVDGAPGAPGERGLDGAKGADGAHGLAGPLNLCDSPFALQLIGVYDYRQTGRLEQGLCSEHGFADDLRHDHKVWTL